MLKAGNDREHQAYRSEIPRFHPRNEALKNTADIREAIAEARRLRLPMHPDAPKTWDSLGALHEILACTTREARILDAGAETYSRLLPWLWLYGYTNLTGNNLVFDRTRQRKIGSIVYEYGDITDSRYEDDTFDAVTCLSVIEHGVDVEQYFAEMSRILKPGGLLITSTDYFESHTETRGQHAFGVPIRIFNKKDIHALLKIGARFGLTPTGTVDFACEERSVTWKEFDLSYTFILLSMKKRA